MTHPFPDTYLLDMVVERAKKSLRAEILKAIEPDIQAHIEKAFLSVEPAIQSYLDHQKSALIVQLMTRRKE